MKSYDINGNIMFGVFKMKERNVVLLPTVVFAEFDSRNVLKKYVITDNADCLSKDYLTLEEGDTDSYTEVGGHTCKDFRCIGIKVKEDFTNIAFFTSDEILQHDLRIQKHTLVALINCFNHHEESSLEVNGFVIRVIPDEEEPMLSITFGNMYEEFYFGDNLDFMLFKYHLEHCLHYMIRGGLN